MKRQIFHLSRRYQAALRTHLGEGRRPGVEAARGLGRQALAAGLQTWDLARLHELILVTQILPGCRAGKRTALIKQAAAFLAAAVASNAKAHSTRREAARLEKFIEALSQRTVELAFSNTELSLEITRRKAAAEALRKSERHYLSLLEKSERLQEQLRRLSRQILSAQEEERRRISRELHDVIAQTLTSINLRLAILKKEAALNPKEFERSIARTQRLVKKSVNIVHQFARELRPAALDDLGLIPALHSFMKNFTGRTGVRAHLTVFAGVEKMGMPQRTVLYRIAQESLTNIARHAKATRADVNIQKLRAGIVMEVTDDGQSFHVESVLRQTGSKHLGLLGMRERVEMIGGAFSVESAPGRGTTVRVEIPFMRALRGASKKSGDVLFTGLGQTPHSAG